MESKVQSELDEIEKALAVLLAQMFECDGAKTERKVALSDAEKREAIKHKLQLILPSELMTRPEPTMLQCQIDEIIKDPVRGVYKNAVRLLGERIFGLTGDISVMLKISERVADRDKNQCDYRYAVIDETWDGIGTSLNYPGWAA